MNGVRTRILVIDRSDDLAQQLRQALHGDDRPEVVLLRQTTRTVEEVVAGGPWDVVVAGPSEHTLTGLRRLVTMRAQAPDVGLVCAVNGTAPADPQALVRTHPDELVQLPAGAATLRKAVTTAVSAANRRRTDFVAERPEPALAAVPRLARVVTVGGPTGGSGKTMLAVNLAYLLHQRDGGKVVLVDLDLQFGEVTAALQLQPRHTTYDVLFDEDDRLLPDAALAETLAESLTQTAVGFLVLPAPRDPAQADAVGPEEVRRLLAALRSLADHIVVDTPTGLRETTLAALDHSDHIVCVTQVDVPGLYNLRTYLDTLDRVGCEEDRRIVVLNKEMPDGGLVASDAGDLLGPVSGVVPFTPLVTRALNEGQALCAASPDHEASRAVVRALGSLLPPDAVHTEPRAHRWWEFWRRSA